MTELTEELAAEFGEPRSSGRTGTWFSADKTRTRPIGAVVGGSGYIQLSAEGLGAGAGCRNGPEQLAATVRPSPRPPGTRAQEIVAELKGRYHRRRARRAQVRIARLTGRPSPHRAPLQGPDRGNMAGEPGWKVPRLWTASFPFSERPSLFALGRRSRRMEGARAATDDELGRCITGVDGARTCCSESCCPGWRTRAGDELHHRFPVAMARASAVSQRRRAAPASRLDRVPARAYSC